MTAPTLYHVDRFGAFAGETSSAQRSPADQDRVWLIPEGATTEAPPAVGEGEVAVLRCGAWSVMLDHRGQTAYDKTMRAGHVIEAPGALGEGETLLAPPSSRHVWAEDHWALSLEDARALRLGEVDAELARRNANGFVYRDKRFQLDDASQQHITSLAVLTQANHGADWPEGFAFITADNERMSFEPMAFVAFAAAATRAVVARRLHARALKDVIIAAADARELAVIDIVGGWN